MKKFIIGIASIFVVFGGLFFAPPDLAYAQTPPTSLEAGPSPSVETALGTGCNISDLGMCAMWLFYNIWLVSSFKIAELAAAVFDFFLGYSLNSDSYTGDFIVKGWGVIRDIANIAFIFTLLYLAIRHILGMSAKKYVPTLIIVALLLNFSLFFTKVVIDGGNILARAFSNSIEIENDTYAEESGYKSISIGILNHINPQNLLSTSLFNQKLTTTGDYSTASGGVQQPGQNDPGYTESNIKNNMGWYFFIFFLLGIVNFVLAWIFLSVALLFLGRTVGLWFAMIFSPIAFITLAVPGGSSLAGKMSFDKWKDTTLKLAFVAPIFIFFLYLTIMFLAIFFTPQVAIENESSVMRLMKVFIPFMLIVVILLRAKSTAEEMAGEAGAMVKSIVGKVAGVAGGVALGGAAMAGRATLGRASTMLLKDGKYNERIKNASGLNKWRLMQEKAALKKMNKSSFDIRNAPKAKGVVGQFSGFVGSQIDQGAKGFGGDKMTFGKGSDRSINKYDEEKEKEKLEMAKDLEKIDRNEDLAILNRILNKDGLNGRDEMLGQINATLGNLENPDWVDRVLGPLSEEQRMDKVSNYQALREAVELSTDARELERAIKDGETRHEDLAGNVTYETTHDGIKGEQKGRRNKYADTVEADKWYSISTDQAEVTADKIRKPEDTKEKKIAKMLRDDEGTPPTTPPPTTPGP